MNDLPLSVIIFDISEFNIFLCQNKPAFNVTNIMRRNKNKYVLILKEIFYLIEHWNRMWTSQELSYYGPKLIGGYTLIIFDNSFFNRYWYGTVILMIFWINEDVSFYDLNSYYRIGASNTPAPTSLVANPRRYEPSTSLMYTTYLKYRANVTLIFLFCSQITPRLVPYSCICSTIKNFTVHNIVLFKIIGQWKLRQMNYCL